MKRFKIYWIWVILFTWSCNSTIVNKSDSISNKYSDQFAGEPSKYLKLAQWQNRLLFSFSYKLELNPNSHDHLIRLYGSHLGKNYIYQNTQVEPGKFYLVTVNLIEYKGRSKNFGLYVYEDDKEIGYHVLDVRKTESRNLLSVKFKAKSDEVTIRLGFRKIGKGEAVFTDPTLQEVKEFADNHMSYYAEYLDDKLILDDFDSLNYHSNVLKIAKYVNSILISPIRNSYEIGNPEEKKKYLNEEKIKREAINIEIEKLLPGTYFAEYTGLTLGESSNCQKSSLSSKNVLDEFNIPTTQVHFVNDDNIGIHQFFQYWHPYLDRWIIVDPFYGVNYVNDNKELIGFDELNEMAKSNNISLRNVVNLEIEYAYFVPEILEKELKMQFENHILGDMRKSLAH